MVELVIVITIAAILMALSLPYFTDWRKNINYRETANAITSFMREARSSAISKGLQQTVEFDPASNGYPVSVPAEVTIRCSADWTSTAKLTIKFNTNGTATITGPDAPLTGNIYVNNTSGTQKYLVTVTQTGRVSSQKK